MPIEVFLRNGVKRLRVVDRDRVVFERDNLTGGHFSGTLSFPGEALQDRDLVFEFSDASGKPLKLETVLVLTGPEPIRWPSLEIRTAAGELPAGGELAFDVTLENDSVLQLEGELRYVLAPHLGWERGEKRRAPLDPSRKEQVIHDVYRVPGASPVLGVYAGASFRFGKFVKTIDAQRFLYRGSWADPIRLHD